MYRRPQFYGGQFLESVENVRQFDKDDQDAPGSEGKGRGFTFDIRRGSS